VRPYELHQPSRGAPRLTLKGERTRERIISSAADLMFTCGVSATTIDDVRAAAG